MEHYLIQERKMIFKKPKNTLQKIAEKSPVLNLLKNNPISKKTEEINRKFYKEKVVPAGKSKAPNYLNLYERLG